ncbi:MAG: hypothetical protein QOI27_1447 [Gaiellaceae bacterium]|nr:hypothetical protein [Gaiellaceae bacterium]
MREAIAPVRRDVAANLEHELVAVAERDETRIAANEDAVPVQADLPAEPGQPLRRQRLAPDGEQAAEGRRAVEDDDTGRIGRPEAGAAASEHDTAELEPRAAQAERRRDDHDAAVREELEMHARGSAQRGRETDAVRRGRRAISRADADGRRHQRGGGEQRKHLRHAIPLLAALGLLAGCGGGGSGTKQGITVQPARSYSLVLTPAKAAAGKPTAFRGRIVQPDGTTLKAFKRGNGPHTGVHLIFVRRDLSTIVHRHPPIAADGTFTDTIAFPAAGPYRVVVDAYPASGPQTNFQLFSTLTVSGSYTPQPLPPLKTTQVVGGYRFTLHGTPHLRAIEPAFLRFTVTSPSGKPATFTPWYGALAHAIFFRKGSLDYFHTHVCSAGAIGCTSALGAAKVTGTSTTPGTLTVGVLVPLPGDWRLFLQCQVDGHIVTAPFTLHVS